MVITKSVTNGYINSQRNFEGIEVSPSLSNYPNTEEAKNEFKIAFIQEGRKTQHGIMILSAVLKEDGFKTEVFSIQIEKSNILNNIFKFKPDILACSVMTPGFQRVIQLIKDYRKVDPKVYVIMGGPHPTSYPNVIFNEPCLDSICRGEGEYALLELANSLANGKLDTRIKNLWFRKEGEIIKNELRPLVELDHLPFPDRDIYFQKYPFLAKGDIKFMVGRGCPFDCSYCFNKKMKKMYEGNGRWVRHKDNKRIIEEIKLVNKKYPIKWISFNDDTFNVNKVKLKEFLEMYMEEIKIPFLCQLRMDLTSEEQVDLLKRAGVERISVAIENGDEAFRKRMLARNMTNEHILNFGKWARERKIRVHAVNIMGFPEETLEMSLSTIRLNAKIKPEFADVGMLSPYPGTEIYDYAKEKGYLNEGFDFNNMTGHKAWSSYKSKIKSEIINKDIPQMMNLRCFFSFLVKYPWMISLIKPLIKLPYNRFYEFFSSITGQFPLDWKYAVDWDERKALLRSVLLTLKNVKN